MEHIFLMSADLRLFDGAAPAGDGGMGESSAQAETNSAPGGSRRGKTGETARVIYGKQVGGSDAGSREKGAPAQGEALGGERRSKGAQRMPGDSRAEQSGLCDDDDAGGEVERAGAATAPTPEERRAQFEAMVSGDMKDLFDERVQGILNRRLKKAKGLQAQTEATRPILDMLGQRYGVEDGDPAKLAKALEADDTYWEEAASKHGMTPPQYREFLRLQRENESFRQEQRRREGQEAADRQVEAWHKEAAQMAADHPGFDLAAECRDPQFLGMLKAGVPVKHAYEVLHLDEIKQSTAAQAAQRTEKQVTDTIRAKGARPSENGTASASGILVKSDPSKLTRADRAEIARRVARGDTIAF